VTLKEIMKLQAEFDAKHAGDFNRTEPIATKNSYVEHILVCLIGEIGEFANIIKKIVRGELSHEDVHQHLTEELADSFIYLIKLCNELDIDLQSAFDQRLEYNRKRFRVYEK